MALFNSSLLTSAGMTVAASAGSSYISSIKDKSVDKDGNWSVSSVANGISGATSDAWTNVSSMASGAKDKVIGLFDSSKASPMKLAGESLNKTVAQGSAKALEFKNVATGVAYPKSFEDKLKAANGGKVPANAIKADSVDITMGLKVRIVASPSIAGNLVFDVMPTISERGAADYDAVQMLHHPGAIQKYRSSSARSWGITGKLIARTREEATLNQQRLNMIRAWRMPYYGVGTAKGTATSSLLGAPPPILTLTAYGSHNIGPVPCVMTSYSWSWPDDVDYLPTMDNEPFPVIINISLELIESYSPSEYSGFDISKYQRGELGPMGAFQRVSAVQNSQQPTKAVVAQEAPAGTATPKVSEPKAVTSNSIGYTGAMSRTFTLANGDTVSQKVAEVKNNKGEKILVWKNTDAPRYYNDGQTVYPTQSGSAYDKYFKSLTGNKGVDGVR